MREIRHLGPVEEVNAMLSAHTKDLQSEPTMTLRDTLALRYVDLVGNLAAYDSQLRTLAARAYFFADVMLAARSK